MCYAEFVKSRSKPGNDILQSLASDDCHKLHMLIGIAGELFELLDAATEAEILEELGDIEFFYQGLCNAYNRPRVVLGHVLGDASEDSLMLAFEPILTWVKREIIYQKQQSPESLTTLFTAFDYTLACLEFQRGRTREAVQTANIEKLTRRYPKQYTDEAAQVRRDKLC